MLYEFGEARMNCVFSWKLRPHVLQGFRENPLATYGTSCTNVMYRREKYANRIP